MLVCLHLVQTRPSSSRLLDDLRLHRLRLSGSRIMHSPMRHHGSIGDASAPAGMSSVQVRVLFPSIKMARCTLADASRSYGSGIQHVVQTRPHRSSSEKQLVKALVRRRLPRHREPAHVDRLARPARRPARKTYAAVEFVHDLRAWTRPARLSPVLFAYRCLVFRSSSCYWTVRWNAANGLGWRMVRRAAGCKFCRLPRVRIPLGGLGGWHWQIGRGGTFCGNTVQQSANIYSVHRDVRSPTTHPVCSAQHHLGQYRPGLPQSHFPRTVDVEHLCGAVSSTVSCLPRPE